MGLPGACPLSWRKKKVIVVAGCQAWSNTPSLSSGLTHTGWFCTNMVTQLSWLHIPAEQAHICPQYTLSTKLSNAHQDSDKISKALDVFLGCPEYPLLLFTLVGTEQHLSVTHALHHGDSGCCCVISPYTMNNTVQLHNQVWTGLISWEESAPFLSWRMQPQARWQILYWFTWHPGLKGWTAKPQSYCSYKTWGEIWFPSAGIAPLAPLLQCWTRIDAYFNTKWELNIR